MYDVCVDEGYLTDGHRDSFFCDSVLKLPYYDEAEVKAARENVHLLTSLYARAYRLPGPVAEVTVRGLDSLFLSERMPRKLRMAALDRLLAHERSRGPLEFVKY